jgi:hypothetical protein
MHVYVYRHVYICINMYTYIYIYIHKYENYTNKYKIFIETVLELVISNRRKIAERMFKNGVDRLEGKMKRYIYIYTCIYEYIYIEWDGPARG